MKQTIAFLFTAYSITTSAYGQRTGPLDVTGAQSNFAQYLRLSTADGTSDNGDAVTNEFNNREHTTGKCFLFNSWAKGSDVKDAGNKPFRRKQRNAR